MSPIPFYLQSAGIVIFLIGVIMLVISKSSESKPFIHERMSDDEIARHLANAEKTPPGAYIVFLGLAVEVIGTLWRILR
jgi:hypothetical protein